MSSRDEKKDGGKVLPRWKTTKTLEDGTVRQGGTRYPKVEADAIAQKREQPGWRNGAKVRR